MSLPQYQVVVINPSTGQSSLVLDGATFSDLRYSRMLNDIGTLAMTLPSTRAIRSAFVLDALIEVYRTGSGGLLQREETYFTRYTHRFIEGDTERFVVGGMSLNHLLTRRVIDPDDDPLQAGGYSTKSGPADAVIRDYVNEQMGELASPARRMANLSLATVTGTGGGVGARERHTILFNLIRDLSVRGHVDFEIVRTNTNHLEFRVGSIGSDKSKTTNYPGGVWIGLNPNRGNLSSPSLELDRKDEKNFCYALGQGQRDRRIVYKALGEGTSDSPWNRVEFAEDIRNIERSDVLGLITGGDAALRDRQVKSSFTYAPTGEESGNIYRVDWDLGDTVTILWDEEERDLRISNVEIEISESGENIRIEVSKV